MTYEAWRITYQDSEQAARAAFKTAEELAAKLTAAEQRIDEVLSANGSLQFKNYQLSAKCQRLDVAEKMAREARERMVAAEQRAEQAERNAVRECERIARESRLTAEAYNDDRLFIVGCDGSIHNRYPQHFEGE